MCLYISKWKTDQESKDKSKRTFFKLFIKESDHLKTPYQSFVIKKAGRVVLPSKEFRERIYDIIGEEGFHARTTEEAIKMDIFYYEYFHKEKAEHVIIEIEVNPEDIVAYGIQNDVAFKSYTIPQDVWNKIF